MCRCTPGIKTPLCGKPGCEKPPQRDPIEWHPLHVTVGLHIEQRDDGGIRVFTSVPGVYLSGRDPAKVFADLGAVLQKCLIENERQLWLGAAPLDENAQVP